MRTKVLHTRNYFRRLGLGVLLLGYAAMLCSQAFVMPNEFGESNVLNTRLVQEVFKNKSNRSAETAANSSVQSKHTQSLNLRINKRFETGKWISILPELITVAPLSAAVPKPLYYYSNHFVSSFLYVGVGRAPPIA